MSGVRGGVGPVIITDGILMHRIVYSLLWYLLLPAALLRLLWRARRQPAYLAHLRERFGWYRRRHAIDNIIWVHAVSVGETRAAEPLVRALQDCYPAHRILMTHTTPTGREAGEQLFGDSVIRCYLPYDLPDAVRRFFRHFRPAAGIILETEIWPNLLHAARETGIPVFLVNARLSARSAESYRRMGGLARMAMSALTGIAAQGSADAERLSALGAPTVCVAGNLKFDFSPSAVLETLGKQWRSTIHQRPVVILASSREGEEACLLETLTQDGAGDSLWVVVPRHPQRFASVAAIFEQRGLRVHFRSAGMPPPDTVEVLVGDSMGEMEAYFAFADVVLMGGSFLDFGSHNLIEPCALSRPVLLGPSTYNFSEAAAAAMAAGAAEQCLDMQAAVARAKTLLADPVRRQEMGRAGLAFTSAHCGATGRVMELIRQHFPGGTGN